MTELKAGLKLSSAACDAQGAALTMKDAKKLSSSD